MGASLRLTNSTFSSRISLSNDSDPANSSHRRQQSVKAPCSSKLAPRSGSQRLATPPQGQSGRMPTASLEKASARAWKPKEAPRQPRFQARLGKPTTGHPTPRPAWQNANSQPKQVPCTQHHFGTLQGTEAGAIGWRNQRPQQELLASWTSSTQRTSLHLSLLASQTAALSLRQSDLRDAAFKKSAPVRGSALAAPVRGARAP